MLVPEKSYGITTGSIMAAIFGASAAWECGEDQRLLSHPDNWLIALNASSGKELWKKHFADEHEQYFSTSSPLIVKNHVIVGVGGDAMDMPGFLDSFDPETANCNGPCGRRRAKEIPRWLPGPMLLPSESMAAA